MEAIDLMFKEIDKRNSDPFMKEIRILERDEREMPSQFYIVSKIPMMTDRESLMSMSRKEIDGGKQVLYVLNSIERDDYPRVDSKIRIDMLKVALFT